MTNGEGFTPGQRTGISLASWLVALIILIPIGLVLICCLFCGGAGVLGSITGGTTAR